MAKSTIDIATSQRHMLLLGKVKDNKALTRAELVELKRYERKAAAKIIANARMPSMSLAKKKKPKEASPAGPGNKKAKKTKKKRKARPSIDKAEVRRLGLESENLTGADAAIKTRMSLADLLKKYPELRDAWDRGRFLRNLRDLARTGASVTQAAKKLRLANGRILRAMIDEDIEVGDLWEQTQLEVYIDIKTAIIEAAKEGKADAVRAVENFLLEEQSQPDFDASHLTTLQLIDLIGKTRNTIHEWVTKYGLPRNTDKTFDLSIFFSWFEDYMLKRISLGEKSAVMLDPLRAIRAEKLKMELASHKSELVDRNEVVIQQVAWCQNLITICERNVEELARLCCNQPREKIREIHRVFFRELHSAAVNVPKALHLPAAQEKKLQKILQELKPTGDKDEENQ